MIEQTVHLGSSVLVLEIREESAPPGAQPSPAFRVRVKGTDCVGVGTLEQAREIALSQWCAKTRVGAN